MALLRQHAPPRDEQDGVDTKPADGRWINTLWQFSRECNAIASINDRFKRAVMRSGLKAVDKDDKPVKTTPSLHSWMVSRAAPFASNIITFLKMFGFVVFTTDKRDMSMQVIQPTLVNIKLKRKATSKIYYCVTSKNDRFTSWPDDHDPRFQIYVSDEFDFDTGKCGGCLAQCYMEYAAYTIFLDSALKIASQQAHPFYFLQCSKTASTSMLGSEFNPGPNRMGISQAHRATAIPGIGGQSLSDKLDMRQYAAEDIMMQNADLIRRMGPANEVIPGMISKLPITHPNPSRFGWQQLPPDIIPVPRTVPASPDFVTNALHLTRSIYQRFGLPYSQVEHHTGNHDEASEGERMQVWEAVEDIRPHVNQILHRASREIFDHAIISNIKRVFEDPEDIIHAIKTSGGPIHLVITPPIDPRESERLFQNWEIQWDARKRHHKEHGTVADDDDFMEEDPRAIVATIGGMGRKGGATSAEEQDAATKNSRNFLANALKRKPAPAHEK